MKLGVSNLAWDTSVEDEAFTLLLTYGARGVEVAPTRIAPWEELSSDKIRAYKSKCQDAGLSITSMQAILFNRPQALLFGDDASFQALQDHMRYVCEIGSQLGAKVLVFGAPGNRKKGDADLGAVWNLAKDRMSALGDIAQSYGTVIGIESVPTYYNCDFLTRIDDVSSFVDECANAGLAVHFDTACVTLAGDSCPEKLAAQIDRIVHFHISEPDLAGFDDPKCDHVGASKILSEQKYKHWAVIEMKQQNATNLSYLEKALQYASQTYN